MSALTATTLTTAPEELSPVSTLAATPPVGNDFPTIYLDSALRIRSVNRAFEQRYGLSHGMLEGRLFFLADGARWHQPELYALLRRVADSVAGETPADSCTFTLPAGMTDNGCASLRARAWRMNTTPFLPHNAPGARGGLRSGMICLSLEELPLPQSEPRDDSRLASLSTELRHALQVVGGTIVLLSHTNDPQTRADVGALNAQLPRLERICADLERYASGGPAPSPTSPLRMRQSSLPEA